MLAKFRNEMGFTQQKMASTIGISKSYYQKVESGERSPSYEFIKKFHKKFPKASIEEIFFNIKDTISAQIK